ncbi:MAG: nicotinate-nucleotide diphosphorylase (carboxylating), partial [Thermodesulfobacteriota bacterium]
MQPLHPQIHKAIQFALAEDIGPGDATTDSIVPAEAQMKGRIIAKENGIIAGLDVARAVYLAVDKEVD